MNIHIDQIIGIAVEAAEQALAMQRAGTLETKSKGLETDLVTAADLANEKLIRARLATFSSTSSTSSTIGFWGEESNQRPQEEFFWVVDPIDGTSNFAGGLPYSAVTIALLQGNRPLLGVTVQMHYRRIYWAKRGEGAYLREPDGSQRRLQVDGVESLRQAQIAGGFPYHAAESADNNLAEFNHFLPRVRSMRILGAAALDIAQVAAGMLSAFWEGWLHPWDCATGVLLVEEAGGRVTGYDGQPWHLDSPGFIASNGKIHAEMLDGIQQARSTLQEKRLAF